MSYGVGTGYGLPALYEPNDFISEDRFAGSLIDQVVVVTGASAGIGSAIAKAFGKTGAKVVAIARREEPLKKLVEEIKSAGGSATAIVRDIAARGAAKELVAEIEQKVGPIDVGVWNAGITRLSPLINEDDDIDTWWRVHEVNVRAPVALTRAALPSMIKRKTGIVITVSSNVATMALPCMAAYTSSKAAISKFHESITPELEGTGVSTFAINPGMVKSELGAPDGALNKEAMQHPAMQAFMSHVQGTAKYQEPELPAQFCVALAAEPRVKVLTGHHLNAEQDLEAVIKEAEKEEMGRVGKDRLYLVNIGFL